MYFCADMSIPCRFPGGLKRPFCNPLCSHAGDWLPHAPVFPSRSRRGNADEQVALALQPWRRTQQSDTSRSFHPRNPSASFQAEHDKSAQQLRSFTRPRQKTQTSGFGQAETLKHDALLSNWLDAACYRSRYSRLCLLRETIQNSRGLLHDQFVNTGPGRPCTAARKTRRATAFPWLELLQLHALRFVQNQCLSCAGFFHAFCLSVILSLFL
jgi:hypothetical protein